MLDGNIDLNRWKVRKFADSVFFSYRRENTDAFLEHRCDSITRNLSAYAFKGSWRKSERNRKTFFRTMIREMDQVRGKQSKWIRQIDRMELISVTKNSSAAQDDDAFDPDLEYSDYAYEDTADEFSSSTMSTSTSTEILSSSLTFDDDLSSNDDANTVSYYDYEEDDDDVESNGQTSITQLSSTTRSTTSTTISTTTTTTIASRVPMYHRRRPIIWNITIEKERSSSGSSLISSSSLFIIFFTLNLIKTWECPLVLLVISIFLVINNKLQAKMDISTFQMICQTSSPWVGIEKSFPAVLFRSDFMACW